MLRAQRGQLINIILCSPFNVLHSVLVDERSEPLSRVFNDQLCDIYRIGERAKRARHSQVCSIENRGYILYTRKMVPIMGRASS